MTDEEAQEIVGIRDDVNKIKRTLGLEDEVRDQATKVKNNYEIHKGKVETMEEQIL